MGAIDLAELRFAWMDDMTDLSKVAMERIDELERENATLRSNVASLEAARDELQKAWKASVKASRLQADADLLEAAKRAAEVLDAEGIVYGDTMDEPLDVLSALKEAIEKAEAR
jgi:hypothetical protein